MYFTNTIPTMMIVLCWTVTTHGFTTNIPPRSTFIGDRTLTNIPVITTTSIFMNIETVKTKENIRVGVIGMLILLSMLSGIWTFRKIYVSHHFLFLNFFRFL
jgi:hypothetical protein